MKSASDLAKNKIPAPTKDVYDEIIDLLNKYISGGGEGVDLRDFQKKVDEGLETVSKEIVGAINEVNKKAGQGGGGVGGLTEEEVKEIVRETAVTQESDPTVPNWAKQPEKPTYTYEEIADKPDMDEQVIESLTANENTMTDEQKASACEFVGAVKRIKTDSAILYGANGNGETTYKASTNAQAWALAIREADGATQVGYPSKPEHAIPKGYFDEKIGDIENALDNIIAIQNALIGTTFDELHEYAQNIIDGGGKE